QFSNTSPQAGTLKRRSDGKIRRWASYPNCEGRKTKRRWPLPRRAFDKGMGTGLPCWGRFVRRQRSAREIFKSEYEAIYELCLRRCASSGGSLFFSACFGKRHFNLQCGQGNLFRANVLGSARRSHKQ